MAPGEYDDETELRREEPTRAVRSWPELAWTDEGGAHRCVLTGRTTIGSAPGAQVRIADREVSRLHAELEPSDRGTWVRDLGSRNGTSVENLQVGAALVPDGARIRMGGTEVVLRYPAAASPVELWPGDRFGGLLGASTPMRELFAQMARVAQTDAPVLILGETGTGKELAARAIHDASARAAGPFVIVDCAALASSIIEGELFGHARGAFTGAIAARAGSFEAAHGGTIFLDEIGELPSALQPKLLRVLESRTIKRLGESEHRPIDVRLVAATHRDLRRMVNAAAFREDLYFRIAVLPLVLPPLRARKDDIPLLFQHFLNRRQPVEPVSPRELAEMPWLGNVRELRNFVERACAIGAKDALQASRVPVSDVGAAPAETNPGGVAFDQPFKEFRERWIDQGEREYLQRLLERHGRNVPAAAEEAGLDRTYVYRLIRKHGL
ncbi:MAG TPA: sigma 54-interacting transcriptional regulator [Polyangia bacterium]|jgi:transcriptional regulator with GAF, ATPase, and Fis domain|nr:sigma 54-interacting transcriptional regulator [Polyangia bacterium]